MAQKTRVFLFVDNSNIWIEGKRLAAENFGADKGRLWRLDFGRLLRLVEQNGPNRMLWGRRMYGSRPPPNDSVWMAAKEKGFELAILDRNAANKEKGVDVELVMDIMEAAMNYPDKCIIAIVAGDGDYHRVPERVAKYGWQTEFYFWDNAANSLKYNANASFHSLDPHLEEIGRWAHKPDEPDFEE